MFCRTSSPLTYVNQPLYLGGNYMVGRKSGQIIGRNGKKLTKLIIGTMVS